MCFVKLWSIEGVVTGSVVEILKAGSGVNDMYGGWSIAIGGLSMCGGKFEHMITCACWLYIWDSRVISEDAMVQ